MEESKPKTNPLAPNDITPLRVTATPQRLRRFHPPETWAQARRDYEEGGRGAGKTRAGAEWLAARAEASPVSEVS